MPTRRVGGAASRIAARITGDARNVADASQPREHAVLDGSLGRGQEFVIAGHGVMPCARDAPFDSAAGEARPVHRHAWSGSAAATTARTQFRCNGSPVHASAGPRRPGPGGSRTGPVG